MREAVVPEVAQQRAQLGEAFGAGAIQAFGACATFFDEACFAQHFGMRGGSAWRQRPLAERNLAVARLLAQPVSDSKSVIVVVP